MSSSAKKTAQQLTSLLLPVVVAQEANNQIIQAIAVDITCVGG
jgi:hypothetical protein